MYYYGYSNLGAIYAKVYDSRVLTHGKPLSLLILRAREDRDT